PTISTALSSSNVTTSGFTLNIGVTDTLSGLSKIIWYYKLSTASSYTSATDTYTTMNGATAGTKTAVTKTKAFSGLAAGTYNAYAVVYDVAGNSKQSSTITITMITQTVWNYGYTGGVQSFAVPVTGTYKLEVWGAKGGGNGGYGDDLGGGLGGYAKGNVKLTAGQTIYVVVGGTGTTGTYTSSGGYNGGGNRCYNGGGGGGGATHIGTRNGTLKAYGNTTGLYIVAGGGGGQGHYGSNSASGGYGGGTTGGEAAGKSGSSDTSYERGRGGTQTAGGTWTMCLSGGFGYGGNGSGATAGGGGGGLYGGSGGYSNNGQWAGGGGGSGYVGGCISGTTSMSNGQRSGHGYATITLVSY
ncbi:MAG: hypothetical protein J6A29_02015, partial [Clostridia bacterium]|nr:hypothetical protein [Clostridia bacterium]